MPEPYRPDPILLDAGRDAVWVSWSQYGVFRREHSQHRLAPVLVWSPRYRKEQAQGAGRGED